MAPPARPVVPVKPRASEPAPVAVKPQRTTQVEELPDLQLPAGRTRSPGTKRFCEHPPLEIPWRIVAIAAVVVVLGITLWVRRSHHASPAATSTPTTVEAKRFAPARVYRGTRRTKHQPPARSRAAQPSAHPSTAISQPASHRRILPLRRRPFRKRKTPKKRPMTRAT